MTGFKKFCFWFHIIMGLALSQISLAAYVPSQPRVGVQISPVLVSTEPENFKGYQIMLSYDPGTWYLNAWSLFIDGGYSHFWVNNVPYYTTLSIYSIAPVFRYNFNSFSYFSPYIDLSIGIAYLNHTHLEKRNLGIHFAFQDRIGVGTFMGLNKQLFLGIHAVHYSNAHLSSRNSGITATAVLDVGYRF